MKRYEKVPFSECFKRDGKTTPFGETFQGHDLKLAGTHLANGAWKKSLNFIFPTKYGIPKSLKG